jgi:hypothetical protein
MFFTHSKKIVILSFYHMVILCPVKELCAVVVGWTNNGEVLIEDSKLRVVAEEDKDFSKLAPLFVSN